MRAGLFITGTDTEVGKTAITAGLARLLHRRGINIGVMKPVASGCAFHDGALHCADTEQLRAAAQVEDAPEQITPIALEEPLSPHIAARMAGAPLETMPTRARVRAAFEHLAGRHDAMLVEGVGGALVPITNDWWVADMAADLALPVLIIASDRLGVINQALLTIEACRARGLTVAGILLNCAACADYSAVTNADALALVTDIPVLGTMPHFLDADNADLIASALDEIGILESLRPWLPQ